MQNHLLGEINRVMKVVVADTDEDYLNELEEYFQDNKDSNIEITNFVNGYDNLLDCIKGECIDALIVDIDIIRSDARGIKGILEIGLQKIIVMMKEINNPDNEELARQGADLVYKFGPASILLETLLRMPYKYYHYQGERIETKVKSEVDEGSNRIIVVHSPKGGTGKTTLAMNLAFQYVAKGVKTLLIDGAMYGNIGALLKIPLRGKGLSSIISILEQNQRIVDNTKFLESMRHAIVKHQVPGGNLDVLVAASPAKMDKLTTEDTDKIMGFFKQESYQVIIIDTSSELSKRNVSFLSLADRVVLVAVPELTCGWNILMLKDIFTNLGVNKEKVCLVLNRSDNEVGFYTKDLKQITGYEILVEIPDYYKQVTGFANRGIVVASKEHLPINRFFKQVAHHLYPVFEHRELKGSILSSIFG